MNWFNGRDFSDAVAQGVRKGMQPTVWESAANAFAESGRRRAEYAHERELILQAQFGQKLEWVQTGGKNPEILFDTPFHITVVKFSVLRHPDIYKNVDWAYWFDQVSSIVAPRKEKDLPDALLSAVNNINSVFADAGYDIDQLMDEREKWVEFDEALSDLEAKEFEKKSKFGRLFKPQFQSLDELFSRLETTVEVRNCHDDDVELLNLSSWASEQLELGLKKFVYVVTYCEDHDGELFWLCEVDIDPEQSLEWLKLIDRTPLFDRNWGRVANDGWNVDVLSWHSVCGCGDQYSPMALFTDALGGEELVQPTFEAEAD
jgi:hypothetical protein